MAFRDNRERKYQLGLKSVPNRCEKDRVQQTVTQSSKIGAVERFRRNDSAQSLRLASQQCQKGILNVREDYAHSTQENY